MIEKLKSIAYSSLFFLLPSWAYAGGSMGGGGPGIQNSLALMMVVVDELPKVYAGHDEFRRASARLSVVGIETASMNLEGESIQVRKLRDSMVDDKFSKEILSQ